MSDEETDDEGRDNIIAILLDNAYRDTQVLLVNEREGDKPSIDRDVEFLFYADEREQAETVSSFINDNRYGDAAVKDADEGKFLVCVTVHMPLRQNVLCSVSALMACVGHFFGIEYDGWSSDIKRGR